MSSHQMALALFQDFSPIGESIESVPQELGFKKNNIFVDIVDLGLIARRAIDVAYFIVAEEAINHQVYEVDINFFKWLMHYPSNNHQHLKKILRECQKAAIQVNDLDEMDESQDRWVSVPLLGPVGISGGKLYFEIHDKLRGHIKNPETFHFLSLRIVFKSLFSKVIYDLVQPHIDVGVTPWIELSLLREKLSCDTKTYLDFKYFRRNIIEKAVAEINEVSNLELTFDSQNIPGSKRIGALRFRVRRTAALDAAKAAMLLLKAQYDVLYKEFGLNTIQINEIILERNRWDDDSIQRAIDYTRYCIARGKVKHSVGGYFMKALKEGYSVGTQDWLLLEAQQAEDLQREEKYEAVKSNHEAEAAKRDARLKEEWEKGLQAYQALSPEEKAQVLGTYYRTTAADLMAKRLSVDVTQLESKMDESWVAQSIGLYMFNTLLRKASIQ